MNFITLSGRRWISHGSSKESSGKEKAGSKKASQEGSSKEEIIFTPHYHIFKAITFFKALLSPDANQVKHAGYYVQGFASPCFFYGLPRDIR